MENEIYFEMTYTITVYKWWLLVNMVKFMINGRYG